MSQKIFLIAKQIGESFSELQKHVDGLKLPLTVALLSTGPIFSTDPAIVLEVDGKQVMCEKTCLEYPYTDFLAEILDGRLDYVPSKALELRFSGGFERLYGLLAFSAAFIECCAGLCYYDSFDSRFYDLCELRIQLEEAETIIRTKAQT